MTQYQIAKSTLKSISLDSKSLYKEDKPLVRMIINDSADMISRDLDLSDHQRNLLSNYACKLHPKN